MKDSNIQLLDLKTAEEISGGFDFVTVLVAFVVGYALKEYTEGYWDAENVTY